MALRRNQTFGWVEEVGWGELFNSTSLMKSFAQILKTDFSLL